MIDANGFKVGDVLLRHDTGGIWWMREVEDSARLCGICVNKHVHYNRGDHSPFNMKTVKRAPTMFTVFAHATELPDEDAMIAMVALIGVDHGAA